MGMHCKYTNTDKILYCWQDCDVAILYCLNFSDTTELDNMGPSNEANIINSVCISIVYLLPEATLIDEIYNTKHGVVSIIWIGELVWAITDESEQLHIGQDFVQAL